MSITLKKKHICPICGYNKLTIPPYSNGVPQYDICSCCGFEFGYDDQDQGKTFETARQKWVFDNKFDWFNKNKMPKKWNKKYALKQLENLKYIQYFTLKDNNNKILVLTLEEYILEISKK